MCREQQRLREFTVGRVELGNVTMPRLIRKWRGDNAQSERSDFGNGYGKVFLEAFATDPDIHPIAEAIIAVPDIYISAAWS